MSLTMDRLLDERPETVYLKRILDDEVDDFEYEMDCTFPPLVPGERQPGNAFGTFAIETEGKIRLADTRVFVRFSCQPWGAAVVEEDEDGRLLIEITYNTEDDNKSVGERDLVMVRGFTPGYNDPE